MAIDRISAVALPLPFMRGAPQRPPTPGQTVALTLGDTVLDDVFATTPDGLPLRLAGFAALARELSVGDVLLMRVLSTSPKLELALFDTPSRPSPGNSQATPQSMQPDQLAQRQMSWRPPEAAALATSWRQMVLGQLQGDAPARRTGPMPAPAVSPAFATLPELKAATTAAAMRSAAGSALVAADPQAPTAALAAPREEAARWSPMSGAERWLFPAYAWAGLHVLLRVVDPEEEQPRHPRRRRRGLLSLRLEVDVPGLGGVAVQIQLSASGVQLVFFVESEAAVQPVRLAMPALAAALAGVDLQLLRCGVARGLPGPGPVPRPDVRDAQSPSVLLPPPLFRAAAEVAVALSSLMPREGFSPVSRQEIFGAGI